MSGETTRKAILIPPLPVKPSSQRGRRNIRRGNEEDISALTLAAISEEEKRKKRVQKRRALYDELFEDQSSSEENAARLILDFEYSTKQELISVDKKLVAKLKPHQRQGVKFLWNACYESLEEIQSGRNGGGAILAHCMGLGKTLQIITFVHTLFRHKETEVKTVLILSPVSTLLNWKAEFTKWLKDLGDWSETNVCVLQSKTTKQQDRISILSRWAKNGGVMIMGYEMFRSMKKSSSNKDDQIYKALQEPGPDLVVCDEGHILKNDKTGVSKALMEIRTPKRIMLTGTPLQNNLIEYYCMVQFVRPNLLGSKEEFRVRFVHPIENAQYIDSTSEDVKLMMERTHLLHSILDGFVQRLDHNVLKPFLPPKHEFVVSIGLSDLQAQLYEYYIKSKTSKATLFRDCDAMRLIWTHPLALKLGDDARQKNQKNKASNESSTAVASSKNNFHSAVAANNSENKENSVVAGNNKVDDEKNTRDPVKPSDDNELGIDFDKINISTPEDKNEKDKSNRNQILSEVNELGIDFNKMTINSSEETNSPWWSSFVSEEDFEDYEKGPKLVLLFALLNACEKINDKVLIFSQSIPSLDMIEHFLNKNSKRGPAGSDGDAGTWEKNLDYFRFDGQTPTEKRMEFCDAFNREDNRRARLFLISTKAGGLGINLTAANRVIVFDATWNPSFDTQSIFRVYRLGQSKPCYIYRFVSQGTMEEKIYDRQVVKQSVSCRVIDEQNIHRHFTRKEITELYTFNRKTPSTQLPELPSDNLMAQLLKEYRNIIISYHVHDSLLENVEDSVSNSAGVENVDHKSKNVECQLKNICHNLEKSEHRPENVNDKPKSKNVECQLKNICHNLEETEQRLENVNDKLESKNVECQPNNIRHNLEKIEHRQLKNIRHNLEETDQRPENVNDNYKPKNIECQLKNIRHNLEKSEHRPKNVNDKPESKNVECQLKNICHNLEETEQRLENVNDKLESKNVECQPNNIRHNLEKIEHRQLKNIRHNLEETDQRPENVNDNSKPKNIECQLKNIRHNLEKSEHRPKNVNDKLKSKNVECQPNNIRHNLEKPEHRPKNVDKKFIGVDRNRQPATERRAKDWKESVAETVDKIEDEWIAKAIRKLYPGDFEFRNDEELLFQIRKGLFHQYMDERKQNRVNQSFVTSAASGIPFEVAVDIIRVLEVTVPRYIQLMRRESGNSHKTELWSKETFIRQEVKKIGLESIREKLEQFYLDDLTGTGKKKMKIMLIMDRVRETLFDHYIREIEKDEFDKLLVAFVFGEIKGKPFIESQVFDDAIKTVVKNTYQLEVTKFE